MKAIIFAILLAFSIFPFNLSWAQYTKPSDTLTVQVLTPYSYKAEDGSTVVIGEVQNKNNFSVTGVKLGVSFYDETGKRLIQHYSKLFQLEEKPHFPLAQNRILL